MPCAGKEHSQNGSGAIEWPPDFQIMGSHMSSLVVVDVAAGELRHTSLVDIQAPTLRQKAGTFELW